MRINHNISALRALNQLEKSNSKLDQSLERLSSGLRINHAADDAAGLAITQKMDMQIRGLEQANRNAMDGISLIQTAEGALNEVQSMLQRVRELAVQASNGTYDDTDRESVQAEVDQLLAEIQRVSEDTEFNEKKLLNGDIDLMNDLTVEEKKIADVVSMSDTVDAGTYGFKVDTVGTSDVNVGISNLTDSLVGKTYTISGQDIVFKDKNSDFELRFVGGTTAGDLKFDILDTGSLNLQIGANQGQTMEIRIPNLSTRALGINDIDLSTEAGAEAAITTADDAVTLISSVRSKLGAYQNRLEHTISNLDSATENMTASMSRILDADMAYEMTQFTQQNIIQQAGTSMLAQANQRPQSLLQLLQG